MRERPITTKDLEDFLKYCKANQLKESLYTLLLWLESNDVGPKEAA